MRQPENKINRRQFLGRLSVSTTVLGAGSLLVQPQQRACAGMTEAKKFAMLIDTNRCTCCHGCTIACLSENNVPDGKYRSWVKKISKGRYPDTSFHFLPRLCNQCEDAPCLNLCPTGATYRTQEDGVVHVDREICIGCHVCIDACPYGARFFNPITQTADKCDFCYHRITRGIEPACVTACTGRARIFGDLNDPQSEIVQYLNVHPTQTIRADLDTRPKVHYVNADESILGADYSAL
jgi:tetrathionate reductase subunit B